MDLVTKKTQILCSQIAMTVLLEYQSIFLVSFFFLSVKSLQPNLRCRFNGFQFVVDLLLFVAVLMKTNKQKRAGRFCFSYNSKFTQLLQMMQEKKSIENLV